MTALAMRPVTYTWKEARGVRVPASTAGPYLEAFVGRGGRAEELVAAAQRESSGHWLRDELWIDRSDAELAEVQRQERAEYLLRNIVVIHPADNVPRRLTAAVRVVSPQEHQEVQQLTYVSREAALRSYRPQVVERGERALRAFENAYGDMQEFAGIVTAIRAYFGS